MSLVILLFVNIHIWDIGYFPKTWFCEGGQWFCEKRTSETTDIQSNKGYLLKSLFYGFKSFPNSRRPNSRQEQLTKLLRNEWCWQNWDDKLNETEFIKEKQILKKQNKLEGRTLRLDVIIRGKWFQVLTRFLMGSPNYNSEIQLWNLENYSWN